MLAHLLYDVKHALKGLRRDRAFTFVAILSIGLGVGANSAIFSLVDQALLRQLPVKQPEQLVLLSWNGRFIGPGWGSGNLLPHPVYLDIKAGSQVFEGVFGRFPTNLHLSIGNTPEPVNAEVVTGSYFSVLGVRPALGRLIEESDDLRPGEHPVVVLSFDYWKNRLAGATDVVGRKVLVNNYPMTVIGVAEPGFRGMDWGEVPVLWVPTMMKRQATDFDWLRNRRGRWLHVFGRLKPGISLQQAHAGLQPWFKAMLETDTRREDWPRVTEEQRRQFLASTLDVLPAAQGRSDLRQQLQRPLLVLLAATAMVLLLACLNVANLCLARAFARRRETSLRTALGASRGRIIQELLAQTGILALGGAALGLFLAPTVMQGLITFLPEHVDLSSAIQPRVLFFALAVAVGTGLLFGVAPALQGSRIDPASALKEQSSTVAGAMNLRRALVIGQISLALILLIGAGLFVRTLTSLRARGPGFDTTSLLLFRIEPARSGYDEQRGKNLLNNLVAKLRARPEIQSAGLSAAGLFMGGSWNTPLTIESEGRVVTDSIHCNGVSPGFFETLDVSLLSGRSFSERDAHERPRAGLTSTANMGFRSAIVNESFARRYFGDHNPIGARLGMGNRPDTRVDIEIVGVVKTFSYRGIRTTDDQAFFPFFEGPFNSAGVFVRTRSASAAAFSSIRAVVREIDPTLPVTGLRTVDDQLDRSLANERLLAILASAFAGLAILLAIVGLYGVISFVVSRRTREIGIRMALGASRSAAIWLILRDAAMMVSAGLAIAIPAVWVLGRLIENQLFGVRSMDGATIAGAALLIALAALIASAVPARRATSVSPMEALRYE